VHVKTASLLFTVSQIVASLLQFIVGKSQCMAYSVTVFHSSHLRVCKTGCYLSTTEQL